MMFDVAKMVRDHIHENGLTQLEFGYSIGFSGAYINQVCQGFMPSKRACVAIAKVVGVSPIVLLAHLEFNKMEAKVHGIDFSMILEPDFLRYHPSLRSVLSADFLAHHGVEA